MTVTNAKSSPESEKCTLKIRRESGKLFTIGCPFPPKSTNFGTLWPEVKKWSWPFEVTVYICKCRSGRFPAGRSDRSPATVLGLAARGAGPVGRHVTGLSGDWLAPGGPEWPGSRPRSAAGFAWRLGRCAGVLRCTSVVRVRGNKGPKRSGILSRLHWWQRWDKCDLVRWHFDLDLRSKNEVDLSRSPYI